MSQNQTVVPTTSVNTSPATLEQNVSVSANLQSEDTRYPGDPEPNLCSIHRHGSNANEDDSDDTSHQQIPRRLLPLIDLLSPSPPAKTHHEELLRCALPTSRAIADYTTLPFSLQRPLPPFLAEVHSRRSRQRRILLFTLEPKIGHYAIMSKSTNTVLGAMEVRYHESHPMASVDHARNHCDYLYEGLVHETKSRPFMLLFKLKVERALPIGKFEALHENIEQPFYFSFKCLGHYDGGFQFPLMKLD